MFKIDVKLIKTLNSTNKLFKNGENTAFLTDYQKKILKFVQSKDFHVRKLLLLYMDTGTGKTLTSLSCAASLLAEGHVKRVIVLSPKSIQEEFMRQFNKFCTLIDPTNKNTGKQKMLKDIRSKLISVCYNSNNTYRYFKEIPNKDNTVYIIDEAHLFCNAVIKTHMPDISKEEYIHNEQCKKVYEEFLKLNNSYFLFLTGTPSTTTPFEMAPLFNLAGVGFPENNEEFMKRYFKGTQIQHKDELQSILKNLIVYVPNDNSRQQLKATPLQVHEIEMSTSQYINYLNDYNQESREKHNTPKIMQMYEDSAKIHGKCCFYFKSVEHGVNSMRQKLESEGYTLASTDYDEVFSHPAKRYIVFTGNESIKTKYSYMRNFNQLQNIYGDYIKYILLSPTGSVGINLGAIRYLGIGSVEYNYSTIRQIMGRCNRLNSHISLPIEDRTLSNNIYLTVLNKKELEKWHTRTTLEHQERYIYQESLRNDKVNEEFRKMMQDISII
jgi:superfamily II DNA or RNA helicase